LLGSRREAPTSIDTVWANRRIDGAGFKLCLLFGIETTWFDIFWMMVLTTTTWGPKIGIL